MPPNYAQRFADLRARAQARLEGALSERLQRRTRQGLPPPGQEPRPFTTAGIQGPSSFIRPGAEWTDWVYPAPSTGGKSGQTFVRQARWSPSQEVLEVIFASGGKLGTGDGWQYDGVTAEDWREYLHAGRSYPMLFEQMRFGTGQPFRSGGAK